MKASAASESEAFGDATPGDTRKPAQLFVAGRAVCVEKIRQDDRIGQPVRHAVLTAERMGHAVDIADVGARVKDTPAHVSRAKHVRARLHVAAVGISLVQAADDARRCFFGHGAGEPVGRTADIGFDGVGERVLPVVAVSMGGRRASFGIEHGVSGMSAKSLMGYLWRAAGSVITAARVVSLPVPAVVGTAMSSGVRFKRATGRACVVRSGAAWQRARR